MQVVPAIVQFVFPGFDFAFVTLPRFGLGAGLQFCLCLAFGFGRRGLEGGAIGVGINLEAPVRIFLSVFGLGNASFFFPLKAFCVGKRLPIHA
jgi:hypothetical protein